MIRRRLVPLCMAAMMMCSSLSVNAAESQSFSSADIGKSTTGKSEVLYSQDSDFTVTIPKKIALGTEKTAQYDVSVKGSVRADEKVTVHPDETFDMSETAGRKTAVTATATQADTAWSCAEITDAGTAKSGSVTAAGLTAGDWSGELVFHINMETQEVHTHKYVESITTEATCEHTGVKTFTCECGDSYTETIAQKAHVAGADGRCVTCGLSQYTDIILTERDFADGYDKGWKNIEANFSSSGISDGVGFYHSIISTFSDNGITYKFEWENDSYGNYKSLSSFGLWSTVTIDSIRCREIELKDGIPVMLFDVTYTDDDSTRTEAAYIYKHYKNF